MLCQNFGLNIKVINTLSPSNTLKVKDYLFYAIERDSGEKWILIDIFIYS